MAKMQKEIPDLRNEVRNRSRTPAMLGQRRNNRERALAALPDRQQLALPASGTAAPPTPNGQGKGKGKRRNKAGQRTSKDGIWSLEQVSNPPEFRNFLTPKNVNKVVCFKFQSRRTVPGSTVVLAAVVPSRTTSAIASKIVSMLCPTERPKVSHLKFRRSRRCLPAALRS